MRIPKREDDNSFVEDLKRAMENATAEIEQLTIFPTDKPHRAVLIENDSVHHPSHYTRGKIEVLDFIEDQGLDYHLGNAVKYICRAGHKSKDTEIQDLEKAVFYINRRIKQLWLNKGDK